MGLCKLLGCRVPDLSPNSAVCLESDLRQLIKFT